MTICNKILSLTNNLLLKKNNQFFFKTMLTKLPTTKLFLDQFIFPAFDVFR